MARQEMVLSFFIALWGGMHPAAWRTKDAPTDPSMDLEHVKSLVQTAERGKFHCFFLADSHALMPERDPKALAHTSNAVRYEPLTLCSVLSAYTKDIGLALTMSTTFNEPYHVARKMASLDHLSGGRACWNVVTSSNSDDAQNFGLDEHMDHSRRYRRADEFVDVVKGLWDSWDDGAFLRDKESGIYFDVERMHRLDHRGEFFSVRGPLNVDRPIQGHPVIAQAGYSPDGLAFAVRVADLMFVHGRDIDAGRTLYAELKDRAAEAGRAADDFLVMTHITSVLGRTQEEAEERYAEIDALLEPLVGLDRLQFMLDFDFAGLPLDGPVPDDIPRTEAHQSLQRLYLDRARDENLTIRQMAHIAAGDFMMPMGVKEMADYITDHFNTTADGFNMNFADAGASLELFVDHVVPELQRRRIFHNDYQGQTLRESLGLPRPQSRYQAGASGRIPPN